MRLIIAVMAGFLGCFVWASAQAGVLIPVPAVKNSASTTAFGINNKNTIVGDWRDNKGAQHSFFGTLDGKYTTFDYTAAKVRATDASGIDDNGNVVGFAATDASDCGGGFLYFRKPGGKILTVTRKGATTFGLMPGISNGTSVGSYYVGEACKSFAIEVQNGKYKKDLPAGDGAAAMGINANGVVVGYYLGHDEQFHGFRLQNGTMTQVDYPNRKMLDTYLYGINDDGTVIGVWDDQNFNDHAFMLDLATNTFTPLSVPGVSDAMATGINNKGFLVVAGNTGQTYVYCPLKASKCPAKGKTMSIFGPSIRPAPGNIIHYQSRRD